MPSLQNSCDVIKVFVNQPFYLFFFSFPVQNEFSLVGLQVLMCIKENFNPENELARYIVLRREQ